MALWYHWKASEQLNRRSFCESGWFDGPTAASAVARLFCQQVLPVFFDMIPEKTNSCLCLAGADIFGGHKERSTGFFPPGKNAVICPGSHGGSEKGVHEQGRDTVSAHDHNGSSVQEKKIGKAFDVGIEGFFHILLKDH